MLDTFFPFSYFSICLGLLIGVGITIVCFGFFSAAIILIAISIGIIRIMPLIQMCKRVVSGILPNELSRIHKNIGESFKIKNPENIREGRHIYMWHPHGVFCLSKFFHIATKYTNWPVRNIKGAAFSLLLWLPFMKEIYEELGAIPSDYFPMKETLLNNVSVSVAAGGMREMLYEDSAILSKRRGIFKMALETGTPLVPIVSVNENSLCSIVDIPWIQDKLKAYDMCVPIPTFKSIYKMSGMLNKPLKEPIFSVVGNPIPVSRIEHPTEEDIAKLRKQYITELKALYKKETSMELKIV